MLHPATAHFAIVLPLIASFFGLIYLFVKTESASKLFTRLTLLAAIAMGVVWYTGSQAGPEIYNYLSEAGQQTLVAHKNLGLNLAIAMGLIAIINMIACKLNKFIIQAVMVVALIATSATTLFQGKMGGEIVYKHGTPFKSLSIMDSLQEASATAEEEDSDEAKVEIYEDALDEITEHSEEIDAYYGLSTSSDEDSDSQE